VLSGPSCSVALPSRACSPDSWLDGVLSLRQLAVTASWSGGSEWALIVQVAALAPQTSGRLLTFGPDMAELLAVVALRQAVLSPVQVQVLVTLRLTVSESVCLGVEHRPGLIPRY
jgi:hypothetical protein